MGVKGQETRDRFIDNAIELVEAGGYFGTGLNQVIAASGVPRGSLYFHFPGGKDQLISEAVTRAGQDVALLINEVEGANTAELVVGLLQALGARLEDSRWRKGCPVATVALETSASNDELQRACSSVYAAWEAGLVARLEAEGHPDAAGAATTTLALIEGALLLARTNRSQEPLHRVARSITALLT
ncbi:TetR/AcrR family transcriptional regulator [Pseudonocardia spinosispora]|uniref:TetR/AcrR family transcriptional regulator n=1 Tax=Pseudonocardia spinosispora TaxID=103441 RepID=UPI000428EA7C|nr:TetR/AcrR family transcriptional regulator [Pseudonocardia spinosispora]